MDETEKNIEEKALKIVDNKNINNIIDDKANDVSDVKSAIDLFATKIALGQEETISKVVNEKQEELRNDAETKRVQAEAERISKEVEKVKQDKQKELAELDKSISIRKAEVDHLKTESDIAQAFFDGNKDILKYIGIREKKSLQTMKMLMFPASIVFIVLQAILMPLTFCGILLETVVSIVGGVCGEIKNNALKIILTVIVVLVVSVVGFLAYFLTAKYFFIK